MKNVHDELVEKAKKYMSRDGGNVRFDYRGFQQETGLSEYRVRQVVADLLRRGSLPVNSDTPESTINHSGGSHPTPVYTNLTEEEFNWRKWLELGRDKAKMMKAASPHQRHAHIVIPADKPVGVVYTADWHLGSAGTDYESWERYIRLILETPRLYLALLGDLIDNFKKFKSVEAILSQVIPPKFQRKMLRDIVKEMVDLGKILYACWGNHDWEFDEKNDGEDHMGDIFARIPSFADTGIAVLEIGQVTYTNLVSHSSKANSKINRLHGNKQMYRLEFPADVVATGHTHNPDFETLTQFEDARELGMPFGGTAIMVKVGTFKTRDKYANRYFGRSGLALPTVVYDPHVHDMTPFRDVEKAVRWLSM